MIERGVLALVVGPSGVGKDSLIACARTAFADNYSFCFPTRIITRPVSTGPEIHVCLTEREFEAAEERGALLLSWRAHGMAYGVPGNAANDLERDCIVVVNVSRTVIATACARVRSTIVFHVTAPRDVLEQRLASRGREAPNAIGQRIERAPPLPSSTATVIEIDNSGPLSGAAARFIEELRLLATSRADSAR